MILRALDPGEAFFYMSDHVSCMNFVVFAERGDHLQPERIRSVLDFVQEENTLLQASIQWGEETGLCFAQAPGQVIELRCHEVTSDNWQGTIEQQLSEPFPEGIAPLMRCLYLQMPASEGSVLALSFHHAIADGRAGTALLQRVLALLATQTEPGQRGEARTLPAMAELHPAKYQWALQPDTAKQLKTDLITDYRRHGPLPAIPWLAADADGRDPRFIRLRFAPEVTQRLVATARKHGASVHGALCAAQLLAKLKLQPSDEPTAFFLSCPVDMRPHLEPAPPVSPTGLFVSIVSATFSIDAKTDLWSLARDIVQQTRLQIARGEGHLFFNMFGLNGAPVMPAHMAPFAKKVMASLNNTMVSNVGAIATVAQDPAVQSISFALCPMPYQALFTAASTYKDQLTLNVGFDAARLAPANAALLSQQIQDLLLNAAGAN
jgi:NRPS condensation-like uncharacterized protein